MQSSQMLLIGHHVGCPLWTVGRAAFVNHSLRHHKKSSPFVRFFPIRSEKQLERQETMLKPSGEAIDRCLLEEVSIVVVGGGRIGRALLQMSGGTATLLRRGEKLASIQQLTPYVGPIVVATHTCDLEAVLHQVPQNRWEDLVWLQGGMLIPWLESKGLKSTTQAVLYMAASPMDPRESQSLMIVIDGGGKSVVRGRWGPVFKALLERGGVRCSVVDDKTFDSVVIEKRLWTSIFWLLCKAHKDSTCGEVASFHKKDVYELASELFSLWNNYTSTQHREDKKLPMDEWVDDRPVSREGLSGDKKDIEVVKRKESLVREDGIVTFNELTFEKDRSNNLEDLVDSLCEYSMAIKDAVPSFEMAVKEFEWRNGWFLRQASTPLHVYWLQEVGLQGIVTKYTVE